MKHTQHLTLSRNLSKTVPVLGLFLLSLSLGLAEDTGTVVVYPVPPRPAGVNPATYPAPKDDWFIKFQGNLKKSKDQQYDLLFDGDSITDYWQTRGKEVWDHHFGKIKAFDFGISGDRTENVLWRLQENQVKGMDPKLIVLLIGTNNIAHNNTADQIAE